MVCLPFGSTIFPAINIQLWRCLWIFQPATFDDMDGISFYQIHIKCNYISMILCHCTPLYLYYTYYIMYIPFIHSIHSYSINIPWISHDFHRDFSTWKSWLIALWFQPLFGTYPLNIPPCLLLPQAPSVPHAGAPEPEILGTLRSPGPSPPSPLRSQPVLPGPSRRNTMR